MAGGKWSDLSKPTQRLIIVGAAVETSLKAAALVDMKRRRQTRSGARNGCGSRP